MALTRLDNLYSSKTGKYLYVSPDDFNASDNLDNRGNSPLRPFKTIQRAFIEVARYSYVPGAGKVDRFDQFSIMLMPGNHYIDNRPGLIDNTTTPEFDFSQVTNEWTDTSKLNLKDSDNVLYKFNATTGGAIVPRGCSLVGYDLRRTVIRPLYVPNPADKDVGRTSIFNLTGGCYLWQFTIKDGDLLDTSPLYNSAEGIGKVYSQPDGTGLVVPEYSHHKICIMEYAENKELDLYYEKVGKAFNKFQPTIDDVGELDALVQENRIVGPLSDSRSIDSLKIEDVGASRAKITIATKIEHGYFENQYVAVLNTALDDELNGTFNISLAGVTDPKVFTYYIDKVSAAVGLTSGNTYNATTAPNALGANAIALAEIDSVESASPYVFNCSIRSTWGQCGMWANGAKATGFRSMVVAQYTGVSLQKDDRAFIRYDRFTNTWNQASLTDAFATVPYHTKGDAYWKDDWRNFHIRASDDAFIQCVSVFAVGFFDHFLMESGGDMSITNSNSNFGNTSLHAIGHKGFAFNQDKGGYITDIIPPKILNDSRATAEKVQYYVLGIPDSNDASNHTRLYLGSANENAEKRPAATIGGFRIGSKRYEKLYAKLDPAVPAGPSEFSATLSPSGFKTYSTALSTLNPVTIGNFIDNKAQDSANQINDNREFIQNEAYEYIINKYTYLDPTDPSFTGTIEIGKCKRDIGLIVDSVVKDLRLTLDTSAIPGDYTATSNINVIQAAESYFIGGSLDYIDSEKTETLESFDYVKNLCIAAMRNWDYLIGPVGGGVGCVITGGSSVIDVGDTAGLIVGMSVAEYAQIDFTNNKLNSGATPNTTRIPTGAFISEIVNSSQIRVATNAGAIVAGGTNSNAYIYFDMTQGYYDTSVAPIADDTTTQDTAYPECGNISTLLQSYFADIASILSNGLTGNGVERRESSVNTDDLAVRSTVFTVNTGGGSSNPHLFETGTAVRLVPRAKTGTNPDKRLIRLPNGFSTNKKYYVIAPGRKTYPYDYSAGSFTRADATQLMLATSPENAAAGIYIYSPETDAIDNDVQIDLYQYVIDGKYDLHRYTCNVASAGIIETDVSHIFDNPGANSLPHAVFFRAATDIPGSSLPQIAGGGTLDDQQVFYARYEKDTDSIAQKKFTIHTSFTDAVNNSANISFTPGSGSNFYVFCDKRESPLRFDPTKGTTGSWYLNVEDESSGGSPRTDSILYRFHLSDYDDSSGKQRTNDTWYERLDDQREKEDRVYRLRYVIPEYLSTVRDPLNGFVIKLRTDETRRLVPQRLLLKPVGAAPSFCPLRNPAKSDEILGLKENEYSSITPTYDPYIDAVTVETESKLAFDVQSVRKKTVDGTEYAELTVIDHRVINQNLRGRLFYALKITEPQGGTFLSNTTLSNANNEVIWTGNCSGAGYIQSVITHVVDAQTTDYYMILKDVTGTLEYNAITDTTFSQQGGTVTTRLAAKPDSIGDPDGKSKSLRDDYLYAIPRAGVYTAIPGDRITVATGGGNVQYEISSVDDVEDFSDTFYVFDIDELQERIPGQQKGVYYLTCIRGNISPFPQGPGVGENFKNFKFSQPISQLYPLNYKNDPLWFQELDSSLVDPPETVSSADNYVHGLVTVNDYKNSETRESTLDLIGNLGTGSLYTNTLVDSNSNTIDHRIRAQSGNATSGAEDRKIPIYGDQITPSANKLYVELRRPSIARSGNHTFEYLGFGPGNYSTGFPLRQEVILTDKQDFYAQSKKEDGGVVFYTGLNSNGDLYIGNRKINAITGEETFLESANLVTEDDDDDDLGSIVTTFDTPVTFNDKISVNGKSFFNDEVEINIESNQGEALRIYSKIGAGDDPTLSRAAFPNPLEGDIVLTKNKIDAAIFSINPRGNSGNPGQPYLLKTHSYQTAPSNKTPDQGATFGNDQIVSYAGEDPTPGDMLLKGAEIGGSGSLGWIYTNKYVLIPDANIAQTKTDGTNVIEITWSGSLLNSNIGNVGVYANSFIRIQGHPVTALNGVWPVKNSGFSRTSNTVEIIVTNTVSSATLVWPGSASLELGETDWREFGVIGSSAIRTEVSNIGDYRLGINTVARAPHTAYNNAFVDSATTNPRANLDVVGNVFISGKKNLNFTDPSNAGLSKTETEQDNALIVGGTSDTPDSVATFRVMTTNNGRVGINTRVDSSVSTNLNRSFVVIGNSRFTDNVQFQSNINLDGAGGSATVSLKTTITTGTVNILNESGFTGTLTIANYAETVEALARVEDLEIANETTTLDLKVANEAATLNFDFASNNTTADFNWLTSTQTLAWDIATSSTDLKFDFGGSSTDASNISVLQFGGGYLGTTGTSVFRIRNRYTAMFGDVSMGENKTLNDTLEVTTNAGKVNFLSNSGVASDVTIAGNASTLILAGQGGLTTIRNSLQVDATAEIRGDLFHNGGTASFNFDADRARMGSTIDSHTGQISAPLDNNVDFARFVADFDIDLDAAGAGTWGATSFQTAPAGVNDDNGNPLLNLTGKKYYLPLKKSPLASLNSDLLGDWQENDDIIIDSPEGTGTHPEILRIAVGGLTKVNTAPYYIIVERLPYGVFLPTNANHPDTTAVRKVNVSIDATWLTSASDGAGANDNFNLAEFGGGLAIGDFLWLSRSVTGSTGEAIRVTASTGAFNKRTYVEDGDGNVTFEIDSVTGATVVSNSVRNGGLTVYGPLEFIGTCSATPANRHFTLSNATIDTFKVDMCDGEITVQQGTLTSDVSVLRSTSTWNSSSTTFNAIEVSVTDTDSNASSNLMRFDVGGTTQFYVRKNGNSFIRGTLLVEDAVTVNDSVFINAANEQFRIRNGSTTTNQFRVDSNTGDTYINGELEVNGDAQFNSDLNIDGVLSVGGDLRFGGKLTLGDDFTIKNSLDPDGPVEFFVDAQTGNTTIGSSGSGTLTVTTSASVGTNLTVGGNATITGDVEITGADLTSSAPTFNVLNGPSTINAFTSATILTIGSNAAGAVTTIRTDLDVQGDLELDGGITTGSESDFTGDLTLKGNFYVENNDTPVALRTFVITADTGDVSIGAVNSGEGSLTIQSSIESSGPGVGSLIVVGGASIAKKLRLTGDFIVGGGSFEVTASSGDTVAGAMALTGDFSINTNIFTIDSSSGDIASIGDLNINNGKFTVASSTGNGLFAGSLSVGSSLTTTGGATIGDDLTINGNAIITDESSFSIVDTTPTTLNLARGATSINMGATTGTTTIRHSLDVDATLNVDGNGEVGGTFNVGNDFKVKNTLTGTTFFEVDAQTGNTIVGDGNNGTLKVESNANSTSVGTGALIIDGGASVALDLRVGDDLFVTDDASISGALSVTGNTTISGDLAVNGGDITTNNTGTFNLLTSSSVSTANVLTGAETINIGNTNSVVNVRDDLDVAGAAQIDGNLTTDGNLTVDGSGSIGNNLTVTGDVTINGGDILVNTSGSANFRINNDGSIDAFRGANGNIIDGYFTPSGGRRWQNIPSNSSSNPLNANVGYFITTTGGNVVAWLPTGNVGDSISFIDIVGGLDYNTFLIIKGQSGATIQGSSSGTFVSGGGGELVVNTPNAGLTLVCSGTDWHLSNV